MEIVRNPELDWPKLVKFREEAAGHVKSKELWDWEYKHADAFFMMDGDKIAGQQSIQPVVWTEDGNQVYHGLSFDVAVHPDYRGIGANKGVGIMMRLARHAITECGCSAYYGFPNANAVHGFMNMGWQNIGQVKLAEESIDSVPAGSTRFIRVKKFVEKPINVPPYNVFKEYGVADLNYRYVSKPGNNYEIFGADGKTEQFIILNTFVDEGKKVVQVMDSVCGKGMIQDVMFLVRDFCMNNGCSEYRYFSLGGTVEKQAWLIFYPNVSDVNMHFGDWDVT